MTARQPMEGPRFADLRSYYEEEARLEGRPTAQGRRVELRDAFIQRLDEENRHTVIDFGSGPGSDAEGFIDAGLRYVGLDLAHGNGVLAHQRGVTVLHGSVTHPPIRPASFDAGWSISTLMHLEPDVMAAAANAMCATLQPGAPMVIGLWGGERGSHIDDVKIPGQRRPFHRRPLDHNVELLASAATVERSELWKGDDDDDFEYHVIHVRTHA